jgi:hypothetical protein
MNSNRGGAAVFLDQPFFRWEFEHHFRQFEAGSVILLFLGTVGAVQGSLLPYHRGEDDKADEGHEEHAAGNGTHNQHEFAGHSKGWHLGLFVAQDLQKQFS